jgi:hypothetical protein
MRFSHSIRPSAMLAAATVYWAVMSSSAMAQAFLQFSATGANPAAIQTTVDSYRSALGTLNPNVAGTQNGGMGRREINWDGVPAAFAAPNNLPANFFNANSPRGVVFSTAGTGFQVSGATTDGGAGQPAPPVFGNINPNYANQFQTFSPQRLFTAVGSNVYDVSFFVAGSTTPAGVRGFGAVFTDVESAGTSIQYFDVNDSPLGTLQVLTGANAGLSFLGAIRSDNLPLIGRVRITSGNAALGAGINDGGAIDLVVADDFLFGEPVNPVPEPVSLSLTGLAASAFVIWRRRRSHFPAGVAPRCS